MHIELLDKNTVFTFNLIGRCINPILFLHRLPFYLPKK
jgi:hypothetical protein